jgi:hypothetical protein
MKIPSRLNHLGFTLLNFVALIHINVFYLPVWRARCVIWQIQITTLRLRWIILLLRLCIWWRRL